VLNLLQTKLSHASTNMSNIFIIEEFICPC
jgi:hypothetical protein